MTHSKDAPTMNGYLPRYRPPNRHDDLEYVHRRLEDIASHIYWLFVSECRDKNLEPEERELVQKYADRYESARAGENIEECERCFADYEAVSYMDEIARKNRHRSGGLDV